MKARAYWVGRGPGWLVNHGRIVGRWTLAGTVHRLPTAGSGRVRREARTVGHVHAGRLRDLLRSEQPQILVSTELEFISQPRVWDRKRGGEIRRGHDGSVPGGGEYRVSMMKIAEIPEITRRLEWSATPLVDGHCGQHVHVSGWRDTLTPRRLQLVWSPLQWFLYTPKRAERDGYARPYTMEANEFLRWLRVRERENYRSPSTGSRYVSLNPQNLGSRQTLEFRLWPGTNRRETILRRCLFAGLVLEAVDSRADAALHLRNRLYSIVNRIRRALSEPDYSEQPHRADRKRSKVKRIKGDRLRRYLLQQARDLIRALLPPERRYLWDLYKVERVMQVRYVDAAWLRHAEQLEEGLESSRDIANVLTAADTGESLESDRAGFRVTEAG